jgi:trimeric autotransporter adhesin
VDAHGGDVLRLQDLNRTAVVQGGIYPVTNTDTEVLRPFPFANVTNGSVKVTDGNGVYSYGSGTATVTLNGRYIRMNDACGAISLSAGAPGNINFGTSGGTDCTAPASGGAGNTHAARSGYYHLTNINRKAATFFPSNTWLNGTLQANMNINQTCNAFWNGSTVNFYRSGGGCSNTGEIAAVFLHEWGHGMDTNSGGSANENGSGEAVGDTFAFLETRTGCIGDNFRPGSPCHNCSSTQCTGVRDVSVFATGGAGTIARPSTVTADAGINCDRFSCPYLQQGIFPYQGPMGYEGHCESYIASGANWDLVQSLRATHGEAQGWALGDTIWYGSLTPSKSAYQVASGGKCNANATVNGCAATNWYTVYLPVDDDDGNLSNGTPNGCRIWDAFNAHGIACGTRPVCTTGATADVSLAMTGPATVLPAANATYTLTARNLGPATATATVQDTLPAGSTYVSSSTTQGTCTPASGTVSCALGALAANGQATIQVTVTAPGFATTITNTAAITGSIGDPASGNNQAQVQTTVGTFTAAPAPLLARINYGGTTGAVPIELSNPGASATAFTITEPVALPWLSVSPASGSVPANGTQDVTATFNATGLSPGLRRGTLRVAAPPFTVPDIPVCFTVGYLDVGPAAFAQQFVHAMAGAGVNGSVLCGDGVFCPPGTVTRAVMAQWLLQGKLGGAYVPPPATGLFTDVPVSDPLTPWIEDLARRGITAGCGPRAYCPAAAVTRAQMSVFLLATLEGSGYTPPPATGTMFADVPVGAFAAAWIEELARRGVTAGCGGGNFCSSASTARDQMSVFVVTTFGLPLCP